MTSSGLFAEFDPATHEQWLAATEASLRGRSIETLIKGSYEGIDINALTSSEDIADIAHVDTLPGQFPFARGAHAAGYHAAPWLIAQEIDIDDPVEFNLELKHALTNGQTAIYLGHHNRFEREDDVASAFADIDLQAVPLLLAGEDRAIATYHRLKDHLGAVATARLRGCLGCDPLHALARRGAIGVDAFEQMAAHVAEAADASPLLGAIAVSSEIYHGAGASAVQELALVAATGVEYLRRMSAYDLAVRLVAGKLGFFLSIGEDFFMEVAKFRALRLIWAQVMRAFEADERARELRVHAHSGERNKTRRDPHVNMLRMTSEALAAAIAGVDSLTLTPFDAPLGKSDAFSRRIARNLQLILQEELQLTRLIDPAGGSWHVERLTDELARAAWKQFQAIEARGGMLACLRSGYVQCEIETVAQGRLRDVKSREAVLVGGNMYADPDEAQPSPQVQAPPLDADAGSGERILATPLKPIRLAEAFETTGKAAGDEA